MPKAEPKTESVAVKRLLLDLENYRTVPQKSEGAALEAMISTSPDRFWALTSSLMDDGYLPTESVIVLRAEKGLVVKEGNRRVAALKLILGILRTPATEIPENIAHAIKALDNDWRRENAKAPCTIFEQRDSAIVDRIVARAHGKGEKAGRDQWNAVARARHGRASGRSESALDLLEVYLDKGKNVTAKQRAEWAGDFQLSVLAEAMKRTAPRLGLTGAPALAAAYPAIRHRDAVEAMIHAIGTKSLGFENLRSATEDFGARFGVPDPAPKGKAAAGGSTTGSGGSTTKKKPSATSSSTTRAAAINDPRSVTLALKSFKPRGKRREKVESLRREAICLKLKDTPLAFCFVLRSMFEISAAAYCADHSGQGGVSRTKKDGSEKKLFDLLREVSNHLSKGGKDQKVVKELHAATVELAKPSGLLSVTSMNQLVHNPRFSLTAGDIATTFGNVLPLLEAMNA